MIDGTDINRISIENLAKEIVKLKERVTELEGVE